ncbi:hypothetical protein J3L11_18825, partial [Shewanella sp. 4t3-1-2LB]|uniref:hypothetical protein n=1 Tax=Shewanella sp. 4t3-1-2LB TaxID=2817682 RepID=UPI001A982DAD
MNKKILLILLIIFCFNCESKDRIPDTLDKLIEEYNHELWVLNYKEAAKTINKISNLLNMKTRDVELLSNIEFKETGGVLRAKIMNG